MPVIAHERPLSALESAAFSAPTSRVPSRNGAVGPAIAVSSALGIGKVANLQQLGSRPWRPRNQPKSQPATTTGGDTLQTAAAWRTDVTVSPLTKRTLAAFHRSLWPFCSEQHLLVVQVIT